MTVLNTVLISRSYMSLVTVSTFMNNMNITWLHTAIAVRNYDGYIQY